MLSLSIAFKSLLMCLFLINSWVAAAVITLVLRLSLSLILGWKCLLFSWPAKKGFLGGHWDQVSFPGKLCYFSIFVYCCMIGIGKKLTQSFLRPKTSSSTPASFLINMGNHLSITPLISLDFLSSLNFPLLSSPPNSPPDFDLSVLD